MVALRKGKMGAMMVKGGRYEYIKEEKHLHVPIKYYVMKTNFDYLRHLYLRFSNVFIINILLNINGV